MTDPKVKSVTGTMRALGHGNRKILIVEDEKNIVEAVKYNLDKEGFRTLTADDGVKGMELARQELPDVILLDWMLPELDGLEVCRLLKQAEETRHIPIIMLTVKSEETDKVLGLEMGADDYVTKPFSPRELVARIRVAIRRASASSKAEVFQIDELRVDWSKYLVTVKGKAAELTSKEFELLRILIEANGRALSRKALLEKVWGYKNPRELQTRTVDFHISQLRKKLDEVANRILTLKKTGYRFVIDE